MSHSARPRDVSSQAMWSLSVARAAALASIAMTACAPARPAPPVLSALPEFALTDHEGIPFTLQQAKGRPWVVDFIFTRCAGACPLMTAQLGRLVPQLPAGTGLLSISVDPTYDPPAVLAAYAKEHHAGPAWKFLTGAPAAVYALSTEGFKLAAMPLPAGEASADGPFLHSQKFVLVDSQARIR